MMSFHIFLILITHLGNSILEDQIIITTPINFKGKVFQEATSIKTTDILHFDMDDGEFFRNNTIVFENHRLRLDKFATLFLL